MGFGMFSRCALYLLFGSLPTFLSMKDGLYVLEHSAIKLTEEENNNISYECPLASFFYLANFFTFIYFSLSLFYFQWVHRITFWWLLPWQQSGCSNPNPITEEPSSNKNPEAKEVKGNCFTLCAKRSHILSSLKDGATGCVRWGGSVRPPEPDCI